MRSIVSLIAVTGAALGSAAVASVIAAAPAAAEPNTPDCTSAAGGTYTGTGITECQSPGNVQINATAPQPVYPYPWDDEFYGPALIIGGGEGPHGGGGHGR